MDDKLDARFESKLTELFDSFPEAWRVANLPRVVFRHQLYSMFSDERHSVDDKLERLLSEKSLLCLSISQDYHGVAYVRFEHFRQRVSKLQEMLSVHHRLYTNKLLLLIESQPDMCYSKEHLRSFDIDDLGLKTLVSLNLLLIKESDEFWLSMPEMCLFISNLSMGRKYLKTLLLRKKSHRHVPIQEMLSMNHSFKKRGVLTMEYLLHDAIGSGTVLRVGYDKSLVALRR